MKVGVSEAHIAASHGKSANILKNLHSLSFCQPTLGSKCILFHKQESGIQITHKSTSSCVHLSGLDGGRTFFNAVKEGDTVIFASDDEQDRILWVQAMYRATGQSHKPVPPTQVQKLNSRGGTTPQLDAPISQFCKF